MLLVLACFSTVAVACGPTEGVVSESLAVSALDPEAVPAYPVVLQGTPFEVGVRFTTSVSGNLDGVRFYKGAGNDGAHTGHLWSADGTLLATATFVDESGSGWQQVSFEPPIAIAAGVGYVASYHSSTGFAYTSGAYGASGLDAPPLHLPTNAGVYAAGPSGTFPDQTNGASYWVDVAFSPDPAPPPPPVGAYGLWDDLATPTTPRLSIAGAFELGVRFRSSVAGTVTSIQFYKGVGNGGAHVGSLWSTGGDLLATGVFTGESASGWQRLLFAAPVAIDANVTYVASYSSSSGFAYDPGFFGPSGFAASPLLATGSVYGVGPAGTFPTVSNGANYWVDVDFDGTPCVPSCDGIECGADDGCGEPCCTGSGCDASACGECEVANPGGCALGCAPAPEYTECSLGTCRAGSCTSQPAASSIYGGSGTPQIPTVLAGYAYELGVRFTHDTAGLVAGVRFYKGAGNEGTHTGHLWTSGGTLLASVTFTDETSSGWQRASFSPPVPISAGVTYVASFHSDTGFAFTQGALVNGLDSGALHVLPSGGVYGAGPAPTFPSSTNGASYWVDVEVDPTTCEPSCDGLACGEDDGCGTPCCAPPPPVGLWTAADLPGTPLVDLPSPYELGVVFTTADAGSVTGVRFYKGLGNAGVHTGHLWTSDGTLLASGTFVGETASGWQRLTFASPIAIAPGTYVASYHSPAGTFAYDAQYFASARTVGPLVAPVGAGVYAQGPEATFPSQSSGANYWVDVDFELAPACVPVCDGLACGTDDGCGTPCLEGTGCTAPGLAWTPLPCGATVHCVTGAIQAAIDGAVSGDVIQVAGGTYAGSLAVTGKALTIVGGLSSDFATWDPIAQPTIVTTSGGSTLRFVDAGGSWLQGFVVQGGTGTCEWGKCKGGGVFASNGDYAIVGNVLEDAGDPDEGGGLYLEGTGLIADNQIRNNRAGRGAGVAVNGEAGGEVTISNNVVEGNRGLDDHGGGLYLADGHFDLIENVVRDNHTGVDAGYGWGGGAIIYGTGTTANLARNEFTNNYAPLMGSGLFVDDEAVVTSENDLFRANLCTRNGGIAIYVDGLTAGSQLTVINATITDNQCVDDAAVSAIYVEKSSSIVLRNTILWGNGAQFFVDPTSSMAVTYSLLETIVTGTGNVTGDPLFADAAAGDVHVRSAAGRYDPGTGSFVLDVATSPAIDAGDPADSFGSESGPNGGRRNLGRFGNSVEASRSP